MKASKTKDSKKVQFKENDFGANLSLLSKKASILENLPATGSSAVPTKQKTQSLGRSMRSGKRLKQPPAKNVRQKEPYIRPEDPYKRASSTVTPSRRLLQRLQKDSNQSSVDRYRNHQSNKARKSPAPKKTKSAKASKKTASDPAEEVSSTGNASSDSCVNEVTSTTSTIEHRPSSQETDEPTSNSVIASQTDQQSTARGTMTDVRPHPEMIKLRVGELNIKDVEIEMNQAAFVQVLQTFPAFLAAVTRGDK